jgi:two-component system alkaline phosphatase synthesis response regulator PhoP
MIHSVLIVESDPTVLEQLSMQVKEFEFRVDCAVDLESAMSKLRSHRQSIVIVDWGLSEGQAIEIIQQIRGNHRMRRTHIMAVSSSSDPAVVETAMNTGADDFFTMPIGASELRSRLLWASNRATTLV